MNQRLLRVIADLRVSLVLLLGISGVSLLGTLIEQDQSLEQYQLLYPANHPALGLFTAEQIIQAGLNHVYQTWWFFSLLGLFATSLLGCTWLQQWPAVKLARRCQFFRSFSPFHRLPLTTQRREPSFLVGVRRVHEAKYAIFQQKNMSYGYHGISGRLAPMVVHLSLLFVLSGTVVSACCGFQAQEIVPKTEPFHLQNFVTSGSGSRLPSLSGRINDFWITYSPTQTVAQFYSDLSLLSPQGTEVDRKTLFVNDPLIYEGVYYYQTDWNLLGVRLQTVRPSVLEYPLLPIVSNANKIWLSWIATTSSSNTGVMILLDNLEGYGSLYNEGGQFLGNWEIQETTTVGSRLRLAEILSSTGLEIKNDPGIPIIYSGFLLLMLSTLLSYRTYSQLWMLQKKKKLWMGGTTNRARFEFEVNFRALTQ